MAFVPRAERAPNLDPVDGPAGPLVTNHRSPLDYLVVVSVCRRCGWRPAMSAGAGRLMFEAADTTVLTIVGADEAWPPGLRPPRLRLPWRRPVVTVRARRVPSGSGGSSSQVTSAIRATMVDLVGAIG